MQKYSRGLILSAMALGLAACGDSGVRVTRDKPADQVAMAPRSEPVFYNGKTYRLDFSPKGPNQFEMAVSGMGPAQQKDAVAVATSALGYFACPEGQKGKLLANPTYAGGKWRMQAKCG
ncbi:hypothetical protein [Aestuariivirga sp.]|uniref:hypothetical protein n=1 Tax=Aestuariivirga sp. TaxID=2650926 RepID=UPI0025C5136B|nr:hypothetical protein [Aestuariivirga sp.]MCA3556588.1 hypothetical protein [Aestuariivirga sp.]